MNSIWNSTNNFPRIIVPVFGNFPDCLFQFAVPRSRLISTHRSQLGMDYVKTVVLSRSTRSGSGFALILTHLRCAAKHILSSQIVFRNMTWRADEFLWRRRLANVALLSLQLLALLIHSLQILLHL